MVIAVIATGTAAMRRVMRYRLRLPAVRTTRAYYAYARAYYRPYYGPGVSVGVGPFGFGFGF